MIMDILLIILFTFIPGLELRFSIPYGILRTDFHWGFVFFLAVVSNAILGPFVYQLLDKVIHLFFFIKRFERFYHKVVERTQKRIHKYVERWGELGFALFIAVPLPGSGSYSGALGAYVLGLDFKKFIIANLIGVTIAGVIVVSLTLTGQQGIQHFFLR